MYINENNVDEIIRASWQAVSDMVDNNHPLSSEKTLCFVFAMEIWKRCGESIQFDFERQCYEGLEGKSKYLDLLICTDEGYKVAIEFKLPKSSRNGNSNQTQTRFSIYRDLARLNWLKNNSIKPDACYFLMATNENSYLNNANIKLHPAFITRHEHSIPVGNNLKVEGIPMSDIGCQFQWYGISKKTPFKIEKEYAWLEPIKV